MPTKRRAARSRAKPAGGPPKQYQFKPGQSGNPAGRPRGSRNLSTIIMEAARENIEVMINGKKRRISMAQATVMQLANKAGDGDHRAMSDFLDRIAEIERRDEEGRPDRFILSPADVEVLRAVHNRIREASPRSEEDE